MLGADLARGRARRLALVDVADVVADGEGLDRGAGLAGGDRRDQGRVDAAAEEDAERHVGDQPRADRGREQPVELADQVGGRLAGLADGGRRRAPVAALGEGAAGLPGQQVSGRQLAGAGEDRALAGDVAEDEVFVDRDRVELGADRGPGGERGQLRGEVEPVARVRVEERLLAEAVAGDQQRPRPRVPDREGEHPLERVHEVGPVLLVEVDQDLGVGPGRQGVAALAQQLLQARVVVDLAVQRRPDRPVLVRERLVPVLDVDHAEAAGAEADAGGGVAVDAFVVGPAVDHRRVHRPRRGPLGVAGAAAYPAHQAAPAAASTCSTRRSRKRTLSHCRACSRIFAGS